MFIGGLQMWVGNSLYEEWEPPSPSLHACCCSALSSWDVSLEVSAPAFGPAGFMLFLCLCFGLGSSMVYVCVCLCMHVRV